jgi:regulator of cell morphogenesis and NO signaling
MFFIHSINILGEYITFVILFILSSKQTDMYQPTNTHLTFDLKMSEVIFSNPYLLLLLEHFGIVVPVHDKSINVVCKENHLNTELFLTFANLYNGESYISGNKLSFDDIPSIIDYLRNSHKYYLEEIYPNVRNTIKQMAEVNTLKEMSLVPKFFVDYFNEVSEHLDYEDKVVFPYVLNLHGQINGMEHSGCKANYSVNVYRDHHNNIEEKLNDLKSLLVKYLPAKNDQVIRRELLFFLSELEYDLNIHSKIEDLILIPLVTKMETYLNNLPHE